MNAQALGGVRVLDLSRILAGPTAAQLLGDFGAEVIKVERPGVGDDARRLGGAALRAPDGSLTDFAPMHVCANRNKKSICIDFTKPEGVDLVRRLACWADVLIENFKVGDLQRYGLDYPGIAALNPRLVYCSVTGFGQTGPYAPRAGFDSIFQAMSGLMSATGLADDMPHGGPMRVGVPITDFIGGLYAVCGILVALHHRDQHSGRGQQIDLSLLDSAISANSIAMAEHFATGKRFRRCGNEQAAVVPSQVLMCLDGSIVLSAPTDTLFARLCAALECAELAEDSRFATGSARVLNRDALTAQLARIVGARARGELLATLEAHGIPASPVYEIDEVLADPQVRHREVEVRAPHPELGSVRIGTNPILLSDTPVASYCAPPMLGEHTEAVLTTVLGLSGEEVARLRDAGVVQTGQRHQSQRGAVDAEANDE